MRRYGFGRCALLGVAARVQVQHVVGRRDFEVAAVDDRIRDLVTQRLLYVLHPLLVVFDRDADDLGVALREVRGETGHVAELRGADRSEILLVTDSVARE